MSIDLLAGQSVVCSGLSGNELYCVIMAGYAPGNLLVGNCVYSLGAVGGIASNLHAQFGGEVPQYTHSISEGRRLALMRLEQELQQSRAAGATGVTSELIIQGGNVEFLSVGSSLFTNNETQTTGTMSTSADGQELFCQIDAGYKPVSIAFGNVAYSIGMGGNLMGSLHQLAHGEVKEYSDIFTTTRSLALRRIAEDASNRNANCVIGIQTNMLPIGTKGIQEMAMIGTASYHPQLAELAQRAGGVLTSDLTAQELWNTTKLGLAPVQLVLGTSVYSLGVMGGIRAALSGIAKGEVSALSELVYGAREQSLKKVQDQATAIGADMVMGIKTYIYELSGGLIEFLAIGTAVKRVEGIATRSEQLPTQAVIKDKDTFIDMTSTNLQATTNTQNPHPEVATNVSPHPPTTT